MIRLAVSDDLRREMAPRLRGATLETCSPDSLSTCDAVAFFLQPPADGPTIEQFLQARKHLLLSVDLCASNEMLQSLAGLAQQAGVRFAVANPERYRASRQLLRQQLDAGKLGEPGLIRVHRWQPPGWPSALLRDLDLILWLFGTYPNLVYAVEQAGVLVHLGFPNGGMALLDHTNQLPAGSGYQSLSVIGSSGAACADDHQNMQLLYRHGRQEAILAEEGLAHYSALVQDFIDALNSGRDLSASVSSWRHALSVAEAVRKSLATRQAIEPEGLH